MTIRNFLKKAIKDRSFKGYFMASVSFIADLFFIVYNLVLGVLYGVVWNVAICGYYFLLIFIKALILYCERKWKDYDDEQKKKNRAWLFRIQNIFLILIDLALIAPITIMTLNKRQVNMGEGTAIGLATYTTYRIITACINYKKIVQLDNLALHGLKAISLKEAIVSIITLQYFLISVFGDGSDMLTLVAFTSAGLLFLAISVSVYQFRYLKNYE